MFHIKTFSDMCDGMLSIVIYANVVLYVICIDTIMLQISMSVPRRMTMTVMLMPSVTTLKEALTVFVRQATKEMARHAKVCERQ